MIDKNNGNFRLSITEWRGEVTQSIKDLKESVKEIKDVQRNSFKDLNDKIDKFIMALNASLEDHKKENNKDLMEVKMASAKIAGVSGLIIGIFLVILKILFKV